jgi:hypothetical protein
LLGAEINSLFSGSDPIDADPIDVLPAARVAFRVSGGTSGALPWWSVDDVIVYGTVTPPPDEP